MKHVQSGYIMILTLMIIAVALSLVSVALNRSTVYAAFSKTMMDREKARQLALGGIQLALSQIAKADADGEQEGEEEPAKPEAAEKEKADEKSQADAKEQKQKKKEPANELQKFLQRLLPLVGRWQTFELTEKQDGIKGVIKICVGSEEGKLNLNHLFDFEKGKFIGEGKENGDTAKLLADIFDTIKAQMGGEPLMPEVIKFLKKRKRKLSEVTELMAIPGFEIFKEALFYEPPSGEKEQKKRPLYLTDLFTVATSKSTLDPWMLSDSVRAGLKFTRMSAGKEGRLSQDALKKVKPNVSFEKDWNTFFKPMYGKDWGPSMKKIESLFNTQFEPRLFSVLSYGTVGSITIRLYAIIERMKPEKDAPFARVAIRQIYSV